MPKPIVLCPLPRDARERVLKEIRKLEARASADEPVLYSDEVDIHLSPKLGRDWMLRGLNDASSPRARTRNSNLADAVDVRYGASHDKAERKNARLFYKLLWLLARRYRRARRIRLVVDNYSIHSASLTQAALAALGDRIVLHFLPPYCPDSNRIERVWQDLHANVTRNHRCKTMNRLLTHCRQYFESYRWPRITGSRPLLRAAA